LHRTGLRDEVSRVGASADDADPLTVVHARRGARHAMRAPRRSQPGGRAPFDQLTFEIQEAIAPPLYPDAHVHDGMRAGPEPAKAQLAIEHRSGNSCAIGTLDAGNACAHARLTVAAL
jgi:hypothetical protein